MDSLPERSKKILFQHNSFAEVSFSNQVSAVPTADPYAALVNKHAHFKAFRPLFDYLVAASPMMATFVEEELRFYGRRQVGREETAPERSSDAEGLLRGLHRKRVAKRQCVIPCGYPPLDTTLRAAQNSSGFAFSNLRPVVFFFANETRLPDAVRDGSFCLYRKGVGAVATDCTELVQEVSRCLRDLAEYEPKIRQLRDEVIYNAGASEEYFARSFESIAKDVSHPDWKYFEWSDHDPMQQLGTGPELSSPLDAFALNIGEPVSDLVPLPTPNCCTANILSAKKREDFLSTDGLQDFHR